MSIRTLLLESHCMHLDIHMDLGYYLKSNRRFLGAFNVDEPWTIKTRLRARMLFTTTNNQSHLVPFWKDRGRTSDMEGKQLIPRMNAFWQCNSSCSWKRSWRFTDRIARAGKSDGWVEKAIPCQMFDLSLSRMESNVIDCSSWWITFLHVILFRWFRVQQHQIHPENYDPCKIQYTSLNFFHFYLFHTSGISSL